MRIVADRERCIGSGQCVLTEPNVFDQSDEDGRVLLRPDRPMPDTTDEAQQAVHNCPGRALSLSDD